jgi:hypothetical protein
MGSLSVLDGFYSISQFLIQGVAALVCKARK